MYSRDYTCCCKMHWYTDNNWLIQYLYHAIVMFCLYHKHANVLFDVLVPHLHSRCIILVDPLMLVDSLVPTYYPLPIILVDSLFRLVHRCIFFCWTPPTWKGLTNYYLHLTLIAHPSNWAEMCRGKCYSGLFLLK